MIIKIKYHESACSITKKWINTYYIRSIIRIPLQMI